MIVTQRAIRHIEERHWPDSPAQGAGKFSPGITEDSLRQLVDRSCRQWARSAEYTRATRAKFTNMISVARSASPLTEDQPTGFAWW